ncbi:MAG: RCC1 domain-containing protein [Bdellovibrionales bacterium]
MGAGHTCGISGGNVYCWGRDFYGQLGNGVNADVEMKVTSPTVIDGQSSWLGVSAGADHSCGIKTETSTAGVKLYRASWKSPTSGDQFLSPQARYFRRMDNS